MTIPACSTAQFPSIPGMSTSSASGEVRFVEQIVPATLQTNDVIDMRIRNITSDDDVTLIDARLSVGS